MLDDANASVGKREPSVGRRPQTHTREHSSHRCYHDRGTDHGARSQPHSRHVRTREVDSPSRKGRTDHHELAQQRSRANNAQNFSPTRVTLPHCGSGSLRQSPNLHRPEAGSTSFSPRPPQLLTPGIHLLPTTCDHPPPKSTKNPTFGKPGHARAGRPSTWPLKGLLHTLPTGPHARSPQPAHAQRPRVAPTC